MSPAWVVICIGVALVLGGAGLVCWVVARSIDAADAWWSE